MTPLIDEVMVAVSSSLAASIVAKVTFTTALGLIAASLARRSRAAVRHAVLAAAFGMLLVMPIASVLAPPIRIAVPAAAPDRILRPTLPGADGAISPAAPARTGIGETSAVPRSALPSLSALLLTAWIAGTALFLLPVVIGLWQVRRLRRSARPWAQGQSIAGALTPAAGTHRRIDVLLHDALPGPMTCGVLHPAILLPPDAQSWAADDVNRAIVHELEHVRRRDWVTHCLARAVCALYWFHPLVWIAWRQLTLQSERSCDDAVLGRSEAIAYADQLVGLAQRLTLPAKPPATKPPLLAMANRADLSARVRAVLDLRQRRGRAGALPIALACGAAAVLVLALSPVKLVAAPQAAGTGAPATPTPNISVETALVTLNVTVTDKNGKPVEGLTANDFAVAEDGTPQTISVFEFQKVAGASQNTRDSISSYYLLGYYASPPNSEGQFRTLSVTDKSDSTARLHYRPGYYPTRLPKRPLVLGDGARSSVDNSFGVDSPPVLSYKKDPEYSEEARKAKYQGTVILNVEVDTTGQVRNLKVRRSLGLGLDEKALEAVKQWKFEPGLKAGKPVAAQAQVELNFRLW